MDFFNSIVHFFIKIISVLKENPIIISIVPIIGGIIKFIDQKIVEHSKKDKNKAKRKIRDYNDWIITSIRKESVFFNEDDPKKLLFYKKMPIERYATKGKSSVKRIRYLSYILLGEAGCGKSSVLKNDFLFHNNKFFSLFRIRSINVFFSRPFLEYGSPKINSVEELVTCLEQSEYKRINIYIDGIDEFGEQKIDELYKSLNVLSHKIKKIKVTSRTSFALQNIINNNYKKPFSFTESQRYIVGQWKNENLIELASLLLKNLKKQSDKAKNLPQIIENNLCNWSGYIDSPLLIKFYVYILLFGNRNIKVILDNKYLFYTQFITEVISTYRKRQGVFSSSNIKKDLDDISNVVFKSFSSDLKYISYSKNIAAILKPEFEGISYFIHETFFEYFVARYYLMQLTNNTLSVGAIKVLIQTYTNDFADFITFALNGTDNDTRKQIVKTLFCIYYYSFDKETVSLFKRKHICNAYKFKIFSDIRSQVQKLEEKHFFTLKYEIVFRLGRIDCCNDDIVDYLNFIYYNDSNIKISDNQEYYVAVLKRCCAISCSFLGAEQIEIDYVKKMIPQNRFGENINYDENYDLANRSHTLIFYGDVTKTNIFEFKDDATNNPFSFAFKKRMERLQYELPFKINDMNKKQRKKYYFRVFDLATIYTFMFNRSRKLNKNELDSVKNARVVFEGSSKERKELMEELVELILKLNASLTNT